MRQLKAEFQNNSVVERGLLARLLTHPEERTTVGLIIMREDFEEPVLGRLFAATMLWGADATQPLALELHRMFLLCGDQAAANSLVDLATAPYPDSFAELIWLAVHIHDQAVYRENLRLEAEARGKWINEECERERFNEQSDDNDLEW